jgi:hypothetical protein
LLLSLLFLPSLVSVALALVVLALLILLI